MTERHKMEQAIARDLELCDIGLAMTKGKTRRKYAEQRKARFTGQIWKSRGSMLPLPASQPMTARRIRPMPNA